MATGNLFNNKGIGVTVSGVTKNYRMAAEEVHALRETNWEVRTGDGRRHHGAERLRQDHAAEPARRGRPADDRDDHDQTARIWRR